jgi:hypothetical protein
MRSYQIPHWFRPDHTCSVDPHGTIIEFGLATTEGTVNGRREVVAKQHSFSSVIFTFSASFIHSPAGGLARSRGWSLLPTLYHIRF